MPLLPGGPIFPSGSKIDFGAWFTVAVHSGDKYKRNEKDIELIGVESPVLWWATESGYDNSTDHTGSAGCSVSTFDYSSRADSAQIKLINSSGVTQYLRAVAIKALPVMRRSGAQGLLHDAFVDYDDIYQSGESKFEFGNNYTVSKAQLEALADYWWKYLRSARHMYGVTVVGTRYDFEPGEWYTLKIGGEGQREYIDSVCECYAVTTSAGAGIAPATAVVFREVYQNWVKDSGAVARFLATGDPRQLPANFGMVVVASKQYMGPADFYCDGTADQTEIQAAINQVAGFGGGMVRLTEGQFNITAAIDLSYDNVVLIGAGAKTIITKNCNDDAISIVGTSDDYIDSVMVRDLRLTADISDQNPVQHLIYGRYTSNVVIENVEADHVYSNGINVLDFIKGAITGCKIHDNTGQGISIGNADNTQIFGNRIYSNGGYGILANGESVAIYANEVFDNGYAGIMGNSAFDVLCRDNRCLNNGGVSYYAVADSIEETAGITVDSNSGDWHVQNNYCKNNGNLINFGTCEEANAPYIIGDATSNTNATWARDAGQAYAGTYSYKHTITATASVSKARFCDNETTTDMHGLYAGTTYELSGYVYVPSAGGPLASEVTIHLEYYNAAAWTSVGVATTGQDAWELVTSGEITIPSTATGIRAYVQIAAAASNGEYCYWDNLRLKPVGTHNLHSQNFYDAGTDTYVGV